MSFIVSRDVFGMDFTDPIREYIDKLDDVIIARYQLGWVHDEFGSNWTMEMAKEYYEEKGMHFCPPDPSSYDTLLILYKMIENDEIEFNPRVKR